MVNYSCERCGKSFSQKSHYTSHKNRKKPCQDNSDLIKNMVEKTVAEKIKELTENTIINSVLNTTGKSTEKSILKSVKSKKKPKLRIVSNDNKGNVIDLFAGTGAFSLVFDNNGFKTVYANDMVEPARKIYEENHKSGLFQLEDLNKVDVKKIPKHDILCGGFPCQPFSIAGKQLGFEDKRSNVFWKILEILNHHKPSVIILENVKNLTSHENGNTYKVILDNLTKLGYHIKSQILDTATITCVPQHRERIYIIGFLDKSKYDSFNFDFKPVQRKNITDMLEQNVPEKYYYKNNLKVYDQVVKGVTDHVSNNTLYQYRRYYVRENKSGCCPTLTANMGGGGHNVPLLKDDKGIRKLTPRECFNFQGFPSDYNLPDLSDSALYKLAGNAVSVPVVDVIVKKLKCIL